MDYYNFDSEVIESLNLLRPPVKRASGNSNRDFTVYCSNNKNSQVLQEFGPKFKSRRENKNYFQQKRHEDSSTSLILKKTSESQIFKQYSVVSYTGLHCQEQSTFPQPKPITKDKPLIKVTVIPKSDQNAAPKLFRKQRIITKTIQATTSNHENSIHTKNVYLVVAGRKKNKIYEIKTTSSVQFEKETVKDEAVDHSSHFKEFIKALNMERKRKKNKKKEAKKNENQVNLCETTTRNIEHICKCSPAGSEVSVHEVRPRSSRVRIFGRIGLTKDDKYVLKCQATVNDKPVLTSALKKEPCDSLPVCSKNAETSTCRRTRDNRVIEEIEQEEEPMLWRNTGVLCVREDSDQDLIEGPKESWRTNDADEEESEDDINEPLRNLKDILMQTEARSNAVHDLLLNIQNKNRISNQSQATQVDFNKIDGTLSKINAYPNNEPVSRCNCFKQDGPLIETIDSSQHYPETLKSCQSPMVIISVFPKHKKADLVQTVQCSHVDNKLAITKYPEKAKIMDEMSVNKTTVIDPECRSPSPNGRKMKFKLHKVIETSHTKSSSRNDLPKLKKEVKKGTNSPKQPQELSNKAGEMEKKRKASPPRSPRAKSPPPPRNREPQNKNISRLSLKTKAKKPKKVDVGINTEHQTTKKALVDSYTNKIAEHMNGNKGPTKTLSTVSINIDSEHEYYDVTFRQDKLNTDVNVRRTVKEASVQKPFKEKNEDVNLFHPHMSKKYKKNSKHKKSFDENQKDDLKKDTPKLAVRDSLEIGHRREVIKVMQTRRSDKQPTVETNDMEFLAPIKHFTGDNCTICDPLERDREIRELLGVDERRNNRHFNDSKNRVVAFENYISRRCFYNNQCEKSYVTGLALSQRLTPCDCTNDNECNDATCKDSDYKSYHDDESEEQEALPQNNTINKPNKSLKQSEKKDKLKTIEDDGGRDKTHPRIISNKSNKTEQKANAEKNTRNVCCQCKDANKQLRGVNSEEYKYELNKNSCACLDTNKCYIPVCKNYTERKITEPDQNNNREQNNQKEPFENNVERKKTNASKQVDLSNSNITSLNQQITLNRNIQIFLQVEQFSKQKPIILSKKQYHKIKKTIQRTIMAREKSKRCVCNRSFVSVSPKYGDFDQIHSNRKTKTVKSIKGSKKSTKSFSKKGDEKPIETVMLYSNEARGSVKDKKPPKVIVKRAASSLEVRNTSISYWKHVTFSSTNMGSIGSSSIANRNQRSLETIFKGHKKSLTPNLGTSAFSLLSEARISESQSMKPIPYPKTKRPFLKRLMSCLVLRSRVSEKIAGPAVYPQSVNSSVDSYHVSTSFGAIEMTSSIYDTSVSFYSDHSIHPLSSKLKRSFLSSVKGFLTSRKS